MLDFFKQRDIKMKMFRKKLYKSIEIFPKAYGGCQMEAYTIDHSQLIHTTGR